MPSGSSSSRRRRTMRAPLKASHRRPNKTAEQAGSADGRSPVKGVHQRRGQPRAQPLERRWLPVKLGRRPRHVLGGGGGGFFCLWPAGSPESPAETTCHFLSRRCTCAGLGTRDVGVTWPLLELHSSRPCMNQQHCKNSMPLRNELEVPWPNHQTPAAKRQIRSRTSTVRTGHDKRYRGEQGHEMKHEI